MPQESGFMEWAGLKMYMMFHKLYATHCKGNKSHEKCIQVVKRHMHLEAGQLHGSTFLRHIIFLLFTVKAITGFTSILMFL